MNSQGSVRVDDRYIDDSDLNNSAVIFFLFSDFVVLG